MSNSFSTLGEGLVIQRDGKIWECVKLFDDTLQFQLPDTGELLNIGQGDLITEISNQVTTIVEAHSSRDVLTYDVDQSTSETITTVLGLPDKYVRQVDFRMLFIEGAIKRKISRGQLALLEECIEEVCAEIKKGELVTPAPAVVNPPERRRRHCAPRHQTHQGKAKDLTEWKPSAISVSRWMQKYESRRRELSALVSGHCHRARPTLIGEEAFEHVDRSIYLHYAIAEAPKRSAAYGKYKDWLNRDFPLGFYGGG